MDASAAVDATGASGDAMFADASVVVDAGIVVDAADSVDAAVEVDAAPIDAGGILNTWDQGLWGQSLWAP